MSVKASKRKPASPNAELIEFLRGLGWKSSTKEDPNSKVFRAAFSKEGRRILLPSKESPWITVQKRNSSAVVWFVDFPPCVELSAILMFIEAT